MASLVGKQLKDTYDSLLKTSDNDALGVTYKEITDGAGNGSGLYLGTGGRVGIGVSSPENALHVAGNQQLEVTSPIGTSLLFTNNAVNQFSADKNYHLIDFNTSSQSSETTGGYVRIKAGQEVSGNDNRSYLSFWTAPNGGTVSEKMRIDSSGNVTIKGSNSTTYEALKLQNTHGSSANQGKTKLEFSVLNSVSTDVRSTIVSEERTADSNLSNLIFSISDNNSGNPAEAFRLTGGTSAGDTTFLRMASGTGGIQFNGDTASANALDDYEEGTWTPTLKGDGTAGTFTYSAQSGSYTKIGRQVTVNMHLTVSGITVSPSGTAIIESLPFTSNAGYYPQGAGFFDNLGSDNRQTSLQINPNSVRIVLIKDTGTTTGHAGLGISEFSGNETIRLTATYFV